MRVYFPYDFDTLCLIKETETYLDLENKEAYKLGYNELIEYINQLTLMLLRK